jgi:quercetin dioxygenase-like cupin family protein
MSDGQVLGAFNLEDEIARFAPGDTAARRRAEILVKDDHLRVVLVTMLDGAELQSHTAPGPITIQPLTGQIMVHYADEERPMAPGELLCLAAGVRHKVTALSAGAFLLTIGWSPTVKEEFATG